MDFLPMTRHQVGVHVFLTKSTKDDVGRAVGHVCMVVAPLKREIAEATHTRSCVPKAYFSMIIHIGASDVHVTVIARQVRCTKVIQ